MHLAWRLPRPLPAEIGAWPLGNRPNMRRLGGSVEATFTLTGKDHQQFYRYLIFRSPTLIICHATLVLTFLLPLVLVVHGIEWLLGHGKPVVLDWRWLVAVGILSALFAWRSDAQTPDEAAKVPGNIGEHWIRITEAGLEARNAVSDEMVAWVRFTRVERSADYIFILIDPTHGYVVPVRAFPSQEEAARFFELATSYWQAARHPAAATPAGGPAPSPSSGEGEAA